jgi:cell shape-determining protein MreC
MTPTKQNHRRVVLIGIVALVILGFVHLGFLLVDADRTWLSWTEPLGFWAVAFLAYKFELDRHHDAV